MRPRRQAQHFHIAPLFYAVPVSQNGRKWLYNYIDYIPSQHLESRHVPVIWPAGLRCKNEEAVFGCSTSVVCNSYAKSSHIMAGSNSLRCQDKPLPELPAQQQHGHNMQCTGQIVNEAPLAKHDSPAVIRSRQLIGNIILRAKTTIFSLLPQSALEHTRLPYVPLETQHELDPHSEDVADRNLARETKFPPRVLSAAYVEPTREASEKLWRKSLVGNIQPLIPSDPFSFYVAEYNRIQAELGHHNRQPKRHEQETKSQLGAWDKKTS